VFVKEVHLTNFRCFAKTQVDLNYPGRRPAKLRPNPTIYRNVNLFLGDNGAGKSSLFRGVALSILAPLAQQNSIPMNSWCVAERRSGPAARPPAHR